MSATSRILPGVAIADVIGQFDAVRVVDGTSFTTLAAAISDLPSTGGVIYVAAGTYDASAATSITKPLKIIGAGKGLTTIRIPNGTSFSGSLFTVQNTA